jgi:hypothetical protein
MNLLVLSDLHLESRPCTIDVPAGADAVVLAGDIAEGTAGIVWALESFPGLPVIYVAGNHEFYGGEVEAATEAMRAAAAGTNVVFLEKAGYVVGGIRFLGATLWTDFFLSAEEDQLEQAWSKADAAYYVPDFHSRIRCRVDGRSVTLTPDIAQRWHRQSAEWLASELAKPFQGMTVVISHHAPSSRSVPECDARHPATPAFASRCDGLVAQADLWIHGHMHQACEYAIGKCRVVCNPRGYAAEASGFKKGKLVGVHP